MGAVTFAPSTQQYTPLDAAAGYWVNGTITFSSSYATGGDTATAAIFGLGVITDFDINSNGAELITWNNSTTAPKFQIWFTGAAAGAVFQEAANASNQSTITATVNVYGY